MRTATLRIEFELSGDASESRLTEALMHRLRDLPTSPQIVSTTEDGKSVRVIGMRRIEIDGSVDYTHRFLGRDK